jgi:DnaJ-class molecular chaperone
MKKPRRKPPLRDPYPEEVDAALRVGSIDFCEVCKGNGTTQIRLDDVTCIGFIESGARFHCVKPERVQIWSLCKVCGGCGTIER